MRRRGGLKLRKPRLSDGQLKMHLDGVCWFCRERLHRGYCCLCKVKDHLHGFHYSMMVRRARWRREDVRMIKEEMTERRRQCALIRLGQLD